MTSKIKRLSIHQENLKVTDIKDFVSKQNKNHLVQNPFRGLFVFKVILVMMFGLIFQNFGIFVIATKAQMGEDYSQPACQQFLEPKNHFFAFCSATLGIQAKSGLHLFFENPIFEN